MIRRRGFLGACLAACAAPVYVRYGSLMVPRALDTPIFVYPGPWPEGKMYVALYTAEPDGTLGQEVNYLNYSRQAINKLADSISFPQCGGGSALVGGARILDRFGRPLWDVAINNRLLISTGLTTNLTISTSERFDYFETPYQGDA